MNITLIEIGIFGVFVWCCTWLQCEFLCICVDLGFSYGVHICGDRGLHICSSFRRARAPYIDRFISFYAPEQICLDLEKCLYLYSTSELYLMGTDIIKSLTVMVVKIPIWILWFYDFTISLAQNNSNLSRIFAIVQNR